MYRLQTNKELHNGELGLECSRSLKRLLPFTGLMFVGVDSCEANNDCDDCVVLRVYVHILGKATKFAKTYAFKCIIHCASKVLKNCVTTTNGKLLGEVQIHNARLDVVHVLLHGTTWIIQKFLAFNGLLCILKGNPMRTLDLM